VSQVGEDTCKTGGQIYHFTRYIYINSQRTFLRFAGCRESCVLRAYQATTVLNLSMIPAFADGSAKTEVICEHLSISFSEASEETDGSIPGCASVDSSPKRAVSGDADMPETSKQTGCHKTFGRWQIWRVSMQLALECLGVHARAVVVNRQGDFKSWRTLQLASGGSRRKRWTQPQLTSKNRQPPSFFGQVDTTRIHILCSKN
jgi:hypothetical protein